MVTTPEGRVKAKVKKHLALLKQTVDLWFYMPVQNGMGTVGIPDFVGCVRGRFFGIETKAPGKRGNLTPNQRQQLHGIASAGGWSWVVDDDETLGDFVRWAQSLNVADKIHASLGGPGAWGCYTEESVR